MRTSLAFRTVTAVLGLIPVLTSTLVITRGSGLDLDPAVIEPSLDNRFRYLAGIYLGLAAVIWWSIINWERAKVPLGYVSGAIFLGGIGRLVSTLDVGSSGPANIFFLYLELALPLYYLAARRALGDTVWADQPAGPIPATDDGSMPATA